MERLVVEKLRGISNRELKAICSVVYFNAFVGYCISNRELKVPNAVKQEPDVAVVHLQ